MARPAAPEVDSESISELLLESSQGKIVPAFPVDLPQPLPQAEPRGHAVHDTLPTDRVDHRCGITDQDSTVMGEFRNARRVRQEMTQSSLNFPSLDPSIRKFLDIRIQEIPQ